MNTRIRKQKHSMFIIFRGLPGGGGKLFSDFIYSLEPAKPGPAEKLVGLCKQLVVQKEKESKPRSE